jgi:hypothetical protein
MIGIILDSPFLGEYPAWMHIVSLSIFFTSGAEIITPYILKEVGAYGKQKLNMIS